MARPTLEVAEIFRTHGPAWRQAQRGHLSLGQHKVMAAIERCRSAALGGHVLQCPACAHAEIAYNSCRNRHCPKCQGSAARRWLQNRQSDLLPVEYYHVVFTLPAPIQAIAYTNKAVVYRLLFQVAAETLQTIAADPRHLGARIGVTLVLHTWGSALTHHPHVHGIVPGGGLSADGQRWVACRPGFFLPVRVLSRRFRHRFLEAMAGAHAAGQLQFFGNDAHLAETTAFADWLRALRATEWVVYAKRPFAGPAAVLAYLSRYTHRVAIANSRLVAMDQGQVTFRWKDYRAKGRTRHKTMTLAAGEFMRRFLLHVLPSGFHRIRHYGLLANAGRREHLARARELLQGHRQTRQPGPAAPTQRSRRHPSRAHPPTSARTAGRRCRSWTRWFGDRTSGHPLPHRPPHEPAQPSDSPPSVASPQATARARLGPPAPGPLRDPASAPPKPPRRADPSLLRHSDVVQMGLVARIPSNGIPSIPIALRATPTTGTGREKRNWGSPLPGAMRTLQKLGSG
jgi:hypothetical protein